MVRWMRWGSKVVVVLDSLLALNQIYALECPFALCQIYLFYKVLFLSFFLIVTRFCFSIYMYVCMFMHSNSCGLASCHVDSHCQTFYPSSLLPQYYSINSLLTALFSFFFFSYKKTKKPKVSCHPSSCLIKKAIWNMNEIQRL